MDKLSTKEMTSMMILYMLGTAIMTGDTFYTTPHPLYIIISFLSALIPIVTCTIIIKNNKKNLFSVIDESFNKFFSKIINLFFVIYAFIIELFYLRYFIIFTKNNILTLHNKLYSYSGERHKGKFKTMDNSIVEVNSLGEKKVRFQPVSAFETEKYIDAMIEAYNKALSLKIPPLLLIPTVIHDFLAIHPFADGNGRMSRLLTLLLFYKNGFFVGKYISLEMIIEETKDIYYEELQASSENWHDGTNNDLPFIKYMLSVIYKAYSECDERFKLISEKSLSSSDRVMKIFENSLEPLSKSDIVVLCPDISQRTIERALKELKDSGLIKQVGKGRSTKYIKV